MGPRCTPTQRAGVHPSRVRATRGCREFRGWCHVCRAGTDSDGHPIYADFAFEGLSSGAIDGDRELGDVSMRNLVGSNLKPLHNSDVDPYGAVNGGVADKNKKYARRLLVTRSTAAWRSWSTRVGV